MVTLSVSSSTNGSSTATASPAFLNQRPMVASVTDSPNVGTRISVMLCFLSPRSVIPGCALFGANPESSTTHCSGFRVRAKEGAPRNDGLSIQRLIQQRLELRQMFRHQPRRGGGGSRAAGVARPLVRRVDLVQHPLQIRLHEMESAHVARF